MKSLVAVCALVGCLLGATACSSDSGENSNSADTAISSARDAVSSAASEVQGSASAAVSSIKATASAAVSNAQDSVGSAQDSAYTQALETQGAAFGSAEDQIAAARAVCDELSGDTSLDAARVTTADSTGLDADQSRTLINIAVPIYCPANVGKLTVN